MCGVPYFKAYDRSAYDPSDTVSDLRRPITLICSWECCQDAEGILAVKPKSAYEIGTASQRNRYRFYGTYFSVPIWGGTYFTWFVPLDFFQLFINSNF